MDEQPARHNRGAAPGWTLLSNHGHVLVSIAANPDIRLRDIADQVGITERAVFGIVRDLEGAGYLERVREGRRNHYRIDAGRPLRHPLEKGHTVADLLTALAQLVPRPRAGADTEPGQHCESDFEPDYGPDCEPDAEVDTAQEGSAG